MSSLNLKTSALNGTIHGIRYKNQIAANFSFGFLCAPPSISWVLLPNFDTVAVKVITISMRVIYVWLQLLLNNIQMCWLSKQWSMVVFSSRIIGFPCSLQDFRAFLNCSCTLWLTEKDRVQYFNKYLLQINCYLHSDLW